MRFKIGYILNLDLILPNYSTKGLFHSEETNISTTQNYITCTPTSKYDASYFYNLNSKSVDNSNVNGL